MKKLFLAVMIAMFGASVALAAEAPKAPVKKEQVQKKKVVKKAKTPKKVVKPVTK